MSITQARDEGRLIRGGLLPAFLGANVKPKDCPPAVAPRWFACLLPWFDLGGLASRWRQRVDRLAEIEARFSRLAAKTEWRVRAMLVDAAAEFAPDHRAVVVCTDVAELCLVRGQNRSVAPAAWVEAVKACERVRHILSVQVGQTKGDRRVALQTAYAAATAAVYAMRVATPYDPPVQTFMVARAAESVLGRSGRLPDQLMDDVLTVLTTDLLA